MHKERGFLILDFGSQLTQLIARRFRELNFYSEVHPFDFPIEKIIEMNPYGIILSGGPSSVYEDGSPRRSLTELRALCPLLGICYGMQLMAQDFGGVVESSKEREYGFTRIDWKNPFNSQLKKSVGNSQNVWMSHGDKIIVPPPGFKICATTENGAVASMMGESAWALQFHPEVAHTEKGLEILKSFAADLCHAPAEWNAPHIIDYQREIVLDKVGPYDHVICGLSGGVDSSVVALLLTKILGAERVHCVFVNNGLLRKNEYESVLKQYEGLGLNVRGVDARNEFLSALAGISDPEKKRKAIGRVFIEVFDKAVQHQDGVKWLAQGTLYPDVIESTSFKGGPSQVIKSHHNVGGLPDRMKLKLLEPLRDLFKDEVRHIGRELGLPDEINYRHPFPGPGLAIRIIGEVTEPKLQIMREADAVFIDALKKKDLYHKIWQAFCVLLPVHTVGVQGDGRTYDQVLALRAVTSRDGMTADWYPFDFDFLREVSNSITNKVKGVSRVVYDVTSKPPATIEWE